MIDECIDCTGPIRRFRQSVYPDGRLAILPNVVRTQVGFAGDEDGAPVLVDDLEPSWADLGRLLAPYEGWHLCSGIPMTLASVAIAVLWLSGR